ncbi:hypothetical protein [Methylobacterium sp. JK268]
MAAFVIVLLYIGLVRVTPIKPRGDGLRAVFLILSGWGMFAYWRPFRRAMAIEGWPTGPYLYAVMIFLFCLASNLNASIGLFWRLAGQPPYLVNNAIFDFWVVLASLALVIAVTVPDLFGKDVPPRDKLQLGSVWLVMLVVVLYLSLIRPDLSGLAEWMRPWLDSGYDYTFDDTKIYDVQP